MQAGQDLNPATSSNEFWRGLKPIASVLRRHAASELYVPGTDDERLYFPLNETTFTRPLMLSRSQNRWCAPLVAKRAGLINRHYHPQQVLTFTVSGKWGYLEHDWTATAGDFVYEPPGESHTLVAYETPEPTVIYSDVTGPLIWLDEKGEPCGFFDVFTFIEMAEAHYEKVGLGADYVRQFFR
ncbi:MAG TPA: 2,4'-dihydroxyacetophenone dioxygenase family protein [Steroidobacteraceae bacterium]|nr:2,4'-dihydroxyacetophenone dioxygenase family protein [Steroidobacteraceae bacterium]